MARGKSGDSGSCLGTLILLGVIGFVLEKIALIMPYVAVIAGVILAIYLISKAIEKNQDRNSRQPVNENPRIKNSSNTRVTKTTNYVEKKASSDEVCLEVHRKVSQSIYKRTEIINSIKDINRVYSQNNHFWNKNSSKCSTIREELSEKRRGLENRLEGSIYTFREESTDVFESMRQVLLEFNKAKTTAYNNTPLSNSILYDYYPVGKAMEFIHYDIEPICLSLEKDIFCLTPHFIVHFRKDGTYVSTYKPSALSVGTKNVDIKERVSHQRYLHTRVDGGPDRRYSYNPIQTYYTEVIKTEYGVLQIRLAGYSLEYKLDDRLKDSMIRTLRAYSRTIPEENFDATFHVVRLLKMCLPNDMKIREVESIMGEL